MKPQQIEQTAKRHKATVALGVLMIIAGVIWWIIGAASGDTGNSGILILVGFLAYLGGRIGAWWDNG